MRVLHHFFVDGLARAGLRGLVMVVAALIVAGCTSYESAYEEGVADYEPIYCYRSLADISCYRKPYVRDQARLENYYGPAPRRYRAPKEKPAQTLAPPPAIDHFELAPEPRPAPPIEACPAEPPAEEPEPEQAAPMEVEPIDIPSI